MNSMSRIEEINESVMLNMKPSRKSKYPKTNNLDDIKV